MQHPKQRDEVATIFSTLLDLGNQHSAQWVVDARLRRSVLAHIGEAQQHQTQKHDLVRHWHDNWCKNRQNDRLSRGHLIAFLQESCYWVAFQATQKLRHSALEKMELPEVFQMTILEVDTVLHKFNPALGANLETYSGHILRTRLRDRLYRGQQYSILTNWALLRHVSREFLATALRQAGLSEYVVAVRLLAWTTYKQLYVPPSQFTMKALPPPEAALWEKMVAHFKQMQLLHLEKPLSENVDAKLLEAWLNECAAAVRSDRQRSVSIDALAERLDIPTGELLPSENLLPFDAVLAEEESQLAKRVNQVLTQALAHLDLKQKELMDLRFRDHLDQKQIAVLLCKTQATVSRRLVTCRAFLATELGRWSVQELHQSLDSHQYKAVEAAIEHWLREHYPRKNGQGEKASTNE